MWKHCLFSSEDESKCSVSKWFKEQDKYYRVILNYCRGSVAIIFQTGKKQNKILTEKDSVT
jgi:hypothetical protein